VNVSQLPQTLKGLGFVDSEAKTATGAATKRVCVFGDESGDTGFDFRPQGGSTEHFLFALVVTEDAQAVIAAVERYHQSLVRGRKPQTESKSSKMSPSDFEEWLKFLNTLPFHARVLVINKKRMLRKDWPPSKETYQHFLHWVLDAHRDIIVAADITMDEIGKSREYQQQVKPHLRQHLNRGPGRAVFEDFRFASSKNNRGIQIADAFCGALKCAIVDNDERFLAFIQGKLRIERR